MKYIASFLFFLALSVQTSWAQDQKKWTLEECLDRALKENISIKQSQLDVEAAKVDQIDAVSAFLPTVNLNANVSENTGLNFDPTNQQPTTIQFLSANGGVNVGYNLFDGLRNFRQSQRAKLATISAQYNQELMEDNIALNVANNFLQVILNKENLKVLSVQHEVTLQQIDRTKELVNGGVLPKGDLLEVQAQSANEVQQIVVAENDVKISLISLAQILLIKDYKTFDIEDPGYAIEGEDILLKTPYEIIDQAKDERYEIKIADQNLAIAKKDLQLSRGALLPSLTAFFNYNTRYSEQDTFNTFEEQLYINDGYSYGLQLNIPILNGFQLRNNVRRSKINIKRSEINLEQAQLDLESSVYQAYVDAQGSLKAYEAAQAASQSQELAYEYAQERYDVGLTNAFDLSQSKQRYDNAQIEVNRTKYDYIFRIKVVELYFGVPATELKF